MLRNFPVAAKLSLGFGAILIVVASSSAFVFSEIRNLSEIERLNGLSNDSIDNVDRAVGEMKPRDPVFANTC